MRSSYQEKDVIILLKDVTGQIAPLATKEREKRIQAGMHYSEMLPLEYEPTAAYLRLFQQSLNTHGRLTAQAIMAVAEKVWRGKNGKVVLISLARAGTPIAILMKRYLEQRYQVEVPHYTISIIRGRGIDENAIRFLLKRHAAETLQFVDGWIGKGAIITELKKEMMKFPKVSAELAVLADPAGLTALFGTREDFLIPSACLNSTVSGLFSRTILNPTLIGKEDFHGAVYYEALQEKDLSYVFIDEIAKYFSEGYVSVEGTEEELSSGMEEVKKIQEDFRIKDINFIKPGIGETTRVLLRRMPWKILVRDFAEEEYIAHIKALCKEKQVELIEYPLQRYRCCGLIQDLHADL